MSLEQQLTQMENHNSPLEQWLREQPMTGFDAPISFRETDMQGMRVLAPAGSAHAVSGKRVAVLFSGGPAAGGHNVIAGLKKALGNNTLFGVKAGPKGLINGDLFEITDVSRILNLGGFDFLGSDRTKIKTDEQFESVRQTVKKFNLNAIVVVGGDDSNTNAAFLAEKVDCQVIGVPKTIDGDLQIGSLLPISFGFDTATKIYAELVGNILQDTPSSRKYWHFIKLMGRSASHIALEVALQTKVPVTLISEEIKAKKMKLQDVVDVINQAVKTRAAAGMQYGVVLVPEGLIEFISDLNISDIPNLKFDSHGNPQVSQIPTEQLLAEKVECNVITHFFGYEGRCGAPSRFDANFTYNLGLTAGSLILDGRTSYMASFTQLDRGGLPLGIPLKSLLTEEIRDGKKSTVIKKALVDLNSPAFNYFASRRDSWVKSDVFASPGPRQFEGRTANQMPITVALNQGYDSLEFQFGSKRVESIIR